MELTVDRVRDGRSMSTRRVTVTQGERPLLVAIASFHDEPAEPDVRRSDRRGRRAPTSCRCSRTGRATSPDERPSTAAPGSSSHRRSRSASAKPPTFLGGPPADGTRSHWMRLPRDVGDDPLLHAALLAYASDYLLLDMAFRSYPDALAPGGFTGFSLDHALWFHRPVRFDRWHLHTQETLALSGHRGLVRGAIHDVDGHLVATRHAGGARAAGATDRARAMMSIPDRLFQQPWPEGEYRFFQLGFVVDDLLAAAAAWARVFGVGPFHVLPPIETCRARIAAPSRASTPGRGGAGGAGADRADPAALRSAERLPRLLDQRRPGFHQLCTVTPDYDGKKAHYERLGYELVGEIDTGD